MDKSNSTTGSIIRKLLYSLVLLGIPTILLITSIDTIKARDKAWYGGGYDPEYAYLFNSLNTACFKLPGHIDHPGTTVQVTGGLVLLGSRVFDQRDESLKEAVLSDPEHYIRILNIATAVIGSLSLFLLALILVNKSGNLWFALMLQLSPFISGFILFNGFTRITQELMHMVAAFGMAAVSIFWYLDRKNEPQRKFILVFGIISGFGMASKLLFAPLLIIPFVLFYPLKDKYRYLIITAISFIVFTLPVIRLYPNMLYWVYRLFFHTGQYGTGSKGIIEPSAYLDDLLNLFVVSPVFAVIFGINILVLLLLVYFRMRRKRWDDLCAARLLLAATLAQAAGYLLVAKQPKEAYLLPYESLAAINVVVILNMASKLIQTKSFKQLFTATVTISCIILVVPYGLSRKEAIYGVEKNPLWENDWQAAISANERTAVICANPGSSPVTGLYFGNSYSLRRYVPELQNLYPDFYILDSGKGLLTCWDTCRNSIDSLFAAYGGRILYIGPPVKDERNIELLKPSDGKWEFDIVKSNDYQVIMEPVEVDGEGKKSSRKLIFCGGEPDPQHPDKLLPSEGIDSPGQISYDRCYSGKSSILTDSRYPFAFSLRPDMLQAGDKIEISVKFYGNPDDVRLVLSADDSALFYETKSPELTATDRQWNTVTMKTEIPFSIGSVVKLYAWNKGSGKIYFDNFRLDISRPLINSDN